MTSPSNCGAMLSYWAWTVEPRSSKRHWSSCAAMQLRNGWHAASMISTETTSHHCPSASAGRHARANLMSLPEPFRGEVWDVDFDDFGIHPAVVLSINPLNVRLGHVAVIPVTGSKGPEQTHVPLTADAGLTRYDESYADITALQPVARSRLITRRGLLTQSEMDHLGRQIETYLGL